MLTFGFHTHTWANICTHTQSHIPPSTTWSPMVIEYRIFPEPNLWSRVVSKPEITCNLFSFLLKNIVSFSSKFSKLSVPYDLISFSKKPGRKLLDLKIFKEKHHKKKKPVTEESSTLNFINSIFIFFFYFPPRLPVYITATTPKINTTLTVTLGSLTYIRNPIYLINKTSQRIISSRLSPL